jgi:hydrogenase maturation factor HypE
MLIKLSDGCAVAAEEVAEVTVRPHSAGVTVRMKHGVGHHLDCDFRKDAYTTMNRLVGEINAALEDKPT